MANKKRLLKLADFLETVPRRNFDMGLFGASLDGDTVKPFSGEFDCGFAGCAMGWAAHGRLFRGLSYDVVSDDFIYSGKAIDGFEAAGELFGVNHDQASWLFQYRGAETPKQVAKRIRKFVAQV